MKETSTENADRFINDMRIVNADSVKPPVERNVIPACIAKYVHVLQAPVHANVERRVTFKDYVMTVRDQLDSGCNIS